MIGRFNDLVRARHHQRTMKYWKAVRENAETANLEELRDIKARSSELHESVVQALNIANERLILPKLGSNAMRSPADATWEYRPDIWRGPVHPIGIAAAKNKTKIGPSAVLFHNCPLSELTVRQVRNEREEDLAPYGLRLDVFRFEGNFLSISLEMPSETVKSLTKGHILRLDTEIQTEKPLESFVRLNIKSGPNVEHHVIEMTQETTEAEFDLSEMRFFENRLERIWVDMIFEGPQMNEITIRDLTFSRRNRSEY